MSDRHKTICDLFTWLVVGGAVIAAVIVTGDAWVLWGFIIPGIISFTRICKDY